MMLALHNTTELETSSVRVGKQGGILRFPLLIAVPLGRAE